MARWLNTKLVCRLILYIFFSFVVVETISAQVDQNDPFHNTYNLGQDAEIVVFRPPYQFNNITPGRIEASIYDTRGAVENGFSLMSTYADTNAHGLYGLSQAFDAATGDLNADGQDNIIAAWEGPNHTITLSVPQIDTTNLQRIGAWYGSVQDYGVPKMFYDSTKFADNKLKSIIRVATGQFDEDAAREFVVAYWADTNDPTGGHVQLVFYKMMNGTPTPTDSIQVGDIRPFQTQYPGILSESNLFDIAVGDFDGDGVDEVAVADVEPGATNGSSFGWKLMAHIVRKDKNTGRWVSYIDSSKPLDSVPYNSNDILVRLSLTSGDYNGDGRADLAYAWEKHPINDQSCSIGLQPLQVTLPSGSSGDIAIPGVYLDPTLITSNSSWGYTVEVSSGDYNKDGIDELLFNAKGQTRVYEFKNHTISSNNLHQIASTYLGNTDQENNRRSSLLTDTDLPYSDSLKSDIVTFSYESGSNKYQLHDYQAQPGQSYTSYSNPTASINGPLNFAYYHWVMVAGDLNADAVHLGTPKRTTVHNIVQPLVILNAPPIHYDVFNGTPYDVNGCFTNGAPCDFKSTYVNATDNTMEVSTEVNADWGVSQSISATVGAGGSGVLKKLPFSVSASITGTLERSYGGGFSKVNGSSKTYKVTVTSDAIADDRIYATVSDYDILEYPTYSKGELAGHVAVVLPKFTGLESLQNTWFAGKSERARTYLSNHEVGNVLSYPESATLPTGATLFGNGGFASGGGADTWELSGSSSQDWELMFSSTEISERTRSSYQTLDRSVSTDLSVSYGVVDVDLEGSMSDSYDNDQISTHKTTVHQESGLKVHFGTIDQSILGTKTYTVSPYVYWNKAGALVLDYAVQPDQSTGVSSWWTQQYGSKPDLTFNLPWFYDEDKGIGSTDPKVQKEETRDIIFNPVNPEPGDIVSIFARVDNYSLADMASGSTLKFYYGDPRDGGTLITNEDGVSSENVPALQARESAIIELAKWKVPADLTNQSKIYAVVDGDSTIDEVHEDNNIAWNLINPKAPTGTAIEGQGSPTLPAHISLEQNYPNPFNPTTTITYSLVQAQNVTLKVYDILGREVATLFKGWQSSGTHKIQFDATRLASGLYFYRMQTKGFVLTRKMMLIK